MLPTVLADSDDDDDNVALDAHEDDAGALSLRGNRPRDGEAATRHYDGANDKSTDSTERLRRQIESAELDLCSNSAPVTMAMAATQSLFSSSYHTTKRRHTDTFESEPRASPGKRARRAKTLKTHSSKQQETPRASDDGNFRPLHDDITTPTSSQSVRFSEHDGASPSSAFSGCVETEWIKHEPVALFKNSGSTVADTSSVQNYLLEQALRANQRESASIARQAGLDKPSSSSFWSTCDQMDSTESIYLQKEQNIGTGESAAITAAENCGREILPGNDVEVEAETAAEADIEVQYLGEATAVRTECDADSIFDEVPMQPLSTERSSPKVMILQQPIEDGSPQRESSTEIQMPTGRNKRKLGDEQFTEPLDPDEAAIGLPKERYVPRPSRRRTMPIVEEPIELSIQPERAARAKRRKTTHLDGVAGKHDTKSSVVKDAAPSDCETLNGDTAPEVQNNGKAKYEISETKHSDAEDRMVAPEQKQTQDDEVFAKPMKSLPKVKSTSRSKRSHTTIFEDHVEFSGPPHSLSLTQRQAMRSSAMRDIQNEAIGSSRRSRRTVVDDEDEQEDEPMMIEVDDQPKEDVAPLKKRGRGRPAKSTADKQTDVVEKAVEDSETDGEESDQADDVPKKRGRGRPPKNRAGQQPAEAVEATAKKQPSPAINDHTPEPPSEGSNSKVANQVHETTPNIIFNQVASTTPPPAADAIKTVPLSEEERRQSPTSHSPIKSSSKVPLRVGLSKRHHIPSLLRVVKPAKPA